MEAAFDKLKLQGKNNLNGLIQWMKDAKIIDGSKITEDNAKKSFGEVNNDIDFKKFQDTLNKLAKEYKQDLDELTSRLCHTVTAMEEAFDKLKKGGKNSVDSLVQWMKESKIIDGVKVTEEKARKLFEGLDQSNVELTKFKEAITKLAEEHKKTADELTKTLAEHGPKLVDAVKAGVNAFKEAMSK